MLSKTIRDILFGKNVILNKVEKSQRSITFTFPAVDDNDILREIKFSANDGFVLYLIKRIEKLENKVNN